MSALVSNTPLRQVTSVKEMLANKNACEQLAAVAASHLNPERMLRTMALSVSKTPKLAECTPLSLLGALMTSASLGLEPNTPLGHAYLIPYGKDAQLVVGYRGYIQLAHNSQQIASLDAAIHYESDPVWKWRRGSEAVLEHETGNETGAMLHAYAIAAIKGGGKIWVVWPEAKLVAHRDRYSQGYKADIKRGKKPTDANVNIWLAQPDLARMKTMVRQLSKWIPQSSSMPQAALYDGARANYAAFAMDPSMGAPEIESAGDGEAAELEAAEAEAEDATVVEDGGAAPVEEAQDAVVTSNATAEAKKPAEAAPPAPKRADPKAAAAAAAEKVRAAAGKPEAKPAQATEEEAAQASVWDVVAGQIKGEIDAAAPADVPDILDLWSDKLVPMMKDAPELHASIVEHARQREEGGAA